MVVPLAEIASLKIERIDLCNLDSLVFGTAL